jgi:hypothetical protein
MSRSGSLIREALRSMAGIMGSESIWTDRRQNSRDARGQLEPHSSSECRDPDASGALGDLVLWPDATD